MDTTERTPMATTRSTDEEPPQGDHAHRHGTMVHRHRDVAGGAARAAVFGVSDGIVSNVALIFGVAAASPERSAVLVAGAAGLLAGATSMAAGEYVSMKAQAELVERELEIERRSLADQPLAERRELAAIYRRRGVDADLADELAEAVMDDPEVALEVHAREELGVDPSETGRPIAAAASSFVAFAIGAMVPLLPWLLAEGDGATAMSALLGAVGATTVGVVLARFTERSIPRTVARQLGWGVVACSATWLIGTWLGGVVA